VGPPSPAAFPCLLHRNLFLPDAAQDLGAPQLPVLGGLSPCPERGVIVAVVPEITMLAWGAALQELRQSRPRNPRRRFGPGTASLSAVGERTTPAGARHTTSRPWRPDRS
jgi:hypothetical protein